jgi:hypothetical protein
MPKPTTKQCLWCDKPALKGLEHCGETKCRLNYNAKMHRRRKGVLPNSERIVVCPAHDYVTERRAQLELAGDLEGLEKLPACKCEFTPSGRQKYCSQTCLYAMEQKTRRDKARSGEDKTPRELLISLISGICVHGADCDVSKYNWNSETFKKFKTDKRHDRTKAIVSKAQEHIAEEGVMSLRHLHYLLVSDGLIENTPEQYARLSDYITEARERGDIDYDSIVDEGRGSKTYSGWDSPSQFIMGMASMYTKKPWETQANHVEIWTEKTSVVSVLETISEEYRVPLRSLKGQGSASYIWESAKSCGHLAKPWFVFYLGDHDPGGYVIEQSAHDRLFELLLDNFSWSIRDVTERLRWKRLGFVKEDFDLFNVTALDAKEKDSNRPKFEAKHGPECAELEGLPPHELRRRVREAVESKMDLTEWKRAMQEEEAERNKLVEVIGAQKV